MAKKYKVGLRTACDYNGVRIEGEKAQGKPLKYGKKCAVKEETQTMLDEYTHYGYEVGVVAVLLRD